MPLRRLQRVVFPCGGMDTYCGGKDVYCGGTEADRSRPVAQ